jgi:hypothetical protein
MEVADIGERLAVSGRSLGIGDRLLLAILSVGVERDQLDGVVSAL